MRHEPRVDRATLAQALRETYGIPVRSLEFVPVGYASACYVVESSDLRHFLKLWPQPGIGLSDPGRREQVLRLVRALHERDLGVRVPAPCLTWDGALWSTFGGMPFAVFPFLPGEAAPAEWPVSLQAELGRTIAAIHRATPALADVLPPRETFDVPFERGLRDALVTLERMGSAARLGLRLLRESMLSRRGDVLAQLDRLHALRHVVAGLPGAFVLCHADIGGDNVLVDGDGRLSVLDWDGATVAPPEHDLQEARWLDPARVLSAYAAAGGVHTLSLEHFAFYLLRRYLRDMTVRLLRMLDERTPPEEDEYLLGGIEQWGFVQWSALDQTLARFADALRRYP